MTLWVRRSAFISVFNLAYTAKHASIREMFVPISDHTLPGAKHRALTDTPIPRLIKITVLLINTALFKPREIILLFALIIIIITIHIRDFTLSQLFMQKLLRPFLIPILYSSPLQRIQLSYRLQTVLQILDQITYIEIKL